MRRTGQNGYMMIVALVFTCLLALAIYSINGKRHLYNDQIAVRIQILKNVQLLQSNIYHSVDCPNTIADPNNIAGANNISTCAKWKAYSSPTGTPGANPPYIEIYGFGAEFASGITSNSAPVSIFPLVQLRARCDTSGNIVPEVQILDGTGKPSVNNDLLYGRDQWIEVYYQPLFPNPFTLSGCQIP